MINNVSITDGSVFTSGKAVETLLRQTASFMKFPIFIPFMMGKKKRKEKIVGWIDVPPIHFIVTITNLFNRDKTVEERQKNKCYDGE